MKKKTFTTAVGIMMVFILSGVSQAEWVSTGGPQEASVNSITSIGDVLFAGVNGGVYRSTDDGVTWTDASEGIRQYEISWLIADNALLFAGVECEGVFRSADSGKSWVAVNDGIEDICISGLAVKNGTVAVGCGSGEGSVFLSTDGGMTWQQSQLPSGNPVISLITCDTSRFGAIAKDGSIFFSGDGMQWERICWVDTADARMLSLCGLWDDTLYVSRNCSFKRFTITGLAVDSSYMCGVKDMIATGDTLFIAHSGGITYTTAGDDHWHWVDIDSRRYSSSCLYKLNGTLFAGTHNGVFRSTDGGQSWALSRKNFCRAGVGIMVSHGGSVFAATGYNGMYRLENGTSWTPVKNGILDDDITCMASDGTRLIAGSWSHENRVFSTTDNGDNWTIIADAYKDNPRAYPDSTDLGNCVDGVTALAISDEAIVAGTYYCGMYRTVDNGGSWMQVGPDGGYPISLTNHGEYLFAAYVSKGVFRSKDHGATWEEVNTGITISDDFEDSIFISSIVSDGSALFVDDFYHGIYRSTDNGDHWEWTDPGLHAGYILSLLSFGDNLFAVTRDGIFVSIDNGSNWEHVNTEAVEDTIIASLAVSDGYLYAGTAGNGVWRCPLSDIPSVGVAAPQILKASPSGEVVCRTSSGTCRITVNLSGTQNVAVTVHDLAGRCVASLVNKRLRAGTYEFTWARGLVTSGTYVVRSVIGEKISSRRIVVW